MEKQEVNIHTERDYAKLLFILVVTACALFVFGSIIYTSIESQFGITPNTEHPIIAAIWMVWITIVPLVLFVVSLALGITYFIDAWQLEDDEDEKIRN